MSTKFTILFLFLFLFGQALEAKSSRKVIRGELVIGIEEDFKNGKAKETFYLKDSKTKKLTEIKFAKGKKPERELVQGAPLEIIGTEEGLAMVADSVEFLASATSAYNTSLTYTVDTPKKILVVLVKMNGGSGGLSAAAVEQALYASTGSVRDMYRKNTWGRIQISGDADGDGKNDIIGPVSINANVTDSCAASTWGSLAKAVAEQQYGTDFTKYTNVIYVLPDNISCNWQGYAIGANSFLHDSTSRATAVLAHELGHNWGLHHASIDSNNDTVIDSEYGDHSCIMGNGTTLRYLNAPHAFRIGTMSHVPSSAVTLTADSNLDIYPLESDPSSVTGPQIVRLQRGTNDYLYLSFRSGQNYLTNSSGSTLTIHGAAERPYRSLLLGNVSSGQTWTDVLSGAQVTVNSVSSARISVSVKVPLLACAPVSPTITIYPAAAVSSPTGSKQISYSIKNNDNLSCAPTTFQIAGRSGAGVSLSLSSSVYLYPGQSSKQLVNISFSELAEGATPFYIDASDSDGVAPEHAQVSASSSLVLDLTAPAAPQYLVATVGRKGRVDLAWGASQDASSVTYLIYRDTGSGFVNIGAVNSLSYVDYPNASAQYAIAAQDSAGNVSGLSNVAIVTTRSGGGGGRKK